MQSFILHIASGQITNKTVVRSRFSELEDGKYLVRINRIKKRSLPQNAYYHGVVVPMVFNGLRAAGFNEVRNNDDAHEVLKHVFLKREMKSEINCEVIPIARSTTELSTVEFNEFLEAIWQWAAEYLGIQIPQPNEQLAMFDEKESD